MGRNIHVPNYHDSSTRNGPNNNWGVSLMVLVCHFLPWVIHSMRRFESALFIHSYMLSQKKMVSEYRERIRACIPSRTASHPESPPPSLTVCCTNALTTPLLAKGFCGKSKQSKWPSGEWLVRGTSGTLQTTGLEVMLYFVIAWPVLFLQNAKYHFLSSQMYLPFRSYTRWFAQCAQHC